MERLFTKPTWPLARLVLLALPVVAAAPSTAWATAHAAEPIAIQIGQPFPDLRLGTLDGELRSIADFRGIKVVLHVFASW